MADLGARTTDMHGEKRPGLERGLAWFAARQHGVVTFAQLVELGLQRGAIEHRLSAGRLHRIHRGVYAVGRPTIDVRGRWLAAVLACGPHAVLSHRSAAALWNLLQGVGQVDVTAARTRHGPAGVRIHRVRGLHRDDRTLCDEIPVTTVARTLLDLAEVLHPRQLERALEQAERLRVLDVAALEQLCARSRGRRGLRPLSTWLASQRAPVVDARSELERRFWELARDAGLPPPACNVAVAGFEVDALWPRERLVVELDGYAFHRTRGAFERDRARDAALQVAGYRVVRVTHRRLDREPAQVIEWLRSLLAA